MELCLSCTDPLNYDTFDFENVHFLMQILEVRNIILEMVGPAH